MEESEGEDEDEEGMGTRMTPAVWYAIGECTAEAAPEGEGGRASVVAPGPPLLLLALFLLALVLGEGVPITRAVGGETRE